MERTGIEPVTSDLQIPGAEAKLGQIRSVKAKLRWLGEVEIGYSGTRFGTRFWCGSEPILTRQSGDRTLAQATVCGFERQLAGRGGDPPCLPLTRRSSVPANHDPSRRCEEESCSRGKHEWPDRRPTRGSGSMKKHERRNPPFVDPNPDHVERVRLATDALCCHRIASRVKMKARKRAWSQVWDQEKRPSGISRVSRTL
jgi:hypothetical protein